MQFSHIILAIFLFVRSQAAAKLDQGDMEQEIINLRANVGDMEREITNLRGDALYSNGEELQSPDVEMLSKWTDCQNLAPFIVTNLSLEEQKNGKDFFWLWEMNHTPNERWKILSNLNFKDPWGPSSNYVEADEIPPAEALDKLSNEFQIKGKKKILFVVHGWNNDVEDSWCTANTIEEHSDKYMVIPIIWKTDRGQLHDWDYRFDRVHTAPPAGTELEKLFDSFFAKISQPKSWMCHSMGCHVTQFFTQDISDDAGWTEENRFDDLFMVAPDVRYDIFNEWPHGSGEDKNECYIGQWKDVVEKIIPDCRLGGGDGFVDMVKNKVHVHFSSNDYSGSYRESRLKLDLVHKWPISSKALITYGNLVAEGGREPLEKYSEKVTFIHQTGFGDKHSYQKTPEMIEYYDMYG